MDKNRPKTFALIVAAGSSARMESEIPKPYMSLHGKPMLRRVIETFLSHPGIDGVRVVISREHHPRYRKLSEGLSLFPCVIGGATRQESVRRGLESIARAHPQRVLIHDAARPLVTHQLIDKVLFALDEAPAVLPATPVADTIKRITDDAVEETLDRSGLMAAQTPQGFDFDAILAAHRTHQSAPVTDDIALAEKAGLAIRVVQGERFNFKITTRDDFSLMETLSASAFETRIGSGTDVHNFIPHDEAAPLAQRTIALCGVKVASEMALQGHSDADAGLHALVDALLGAIGGGDIGAHFPPDDPKWTGADSSRFLIHAYQLLKERGGDIVNIDITFLCEKPKIAPHRDAMRERIAGLLKMDTDRINIKATTTEKLGFLGRGEGLAAQAVVSVRVPSVK